MSYRYPYLQQLRERSERDANEMVVSIACVLYRVDDLPDKVATIIARKAVETAEECLREMASKIPSRKPDIDPMDSFPDEDGS